MTKTFKQHMAETYSHNELADMANHGANTGHHGLIWNNDLVALFDRYRDDLFTIMADYADMCGEKGLPRFVAERCDDFESFAGSVVYFCAEWVAQEITQGEYQNEEV